MEALEDATVIRSPSSFPVWKAFSVGTRPLSEVMRRIGNSDTTEHIRNRYALEEKPLGPYFAQVASRTVGELGFAQEREPVYLGRLVRSAILNGFEPVFALTALTLRDIYVDQPEDEMLYVPLKTCGAGFPFEVLYLTRENGAPVVRLSGKQFFGLNDRFVFKTPFGIR
ncbi:MAG: hypothetical protein ABA06_01560 [Parcubacteria bacterium C7867-001]|nr:MAG: hypothetical protein ABA06_01560 [Parcubacteria bacterium C7867-001]